ncbi:GL20270 [Drosophila persimilis]|uniref:GL20270 n=1 Tax=Drosophila persimilis TaxID=7234 RepID=B4GXG5_DROPE|nr:GL20270 [Drosophila persimilis]
MLTSIRFLPLTIALTGALFGLTMSYKVEPLPDSYAGLGEGPHWDVATQSLYYVDFSPVGCARRVVIVNLGWSLAVAQSGAHPVEVQPEMDKNRLNDAKADPRGRFFGGTMRYIGDEFEFRHGELYKWEAGGQVSIVKGDVGISNGLAWDEKAKKFYYIDTTDYEVKSYDYDFETGVSSNPKVIFNLRKTSPKDHLLPDGLTIDTEGNLYVATFNGATIFKVNPNTGKVLLEIKFPTKQITSAAFGGPNLDILYVTTAAKFDQPAPAGTTYKVTGLNATGYPGAYLKA